MTLPDWIIRRLKRMAIRTSMARKPDFLIGGESDPYLKRWWIVPRNRWFNIYLHHFLRSDDDRALHDHPWWNVSILIDGEYTEHTIAAGGVNVRNVYRSGNLKFRTAGAAHRVELRTGSCWTLFITGPIVREWGFHCPQGWRPWKQFVDSRDRGAIGRGCE